MGLKHLFNVLYSINYSISSNVHKASESIKSQQETFYIVLILFVIVIEQHKTFIKER